MRSARRNIGEHSTNPSSLPAAGRPDEAVSHPRIGCLTDPDNRRGLGIRCSAIIPGSNVMALIRAEHSVESGKSHFSAELERILSFVQRAERDVRGVFLIEEL